jgi:mono/diheme cytochrome c family protein
MKLLKLAFLALLLVLISAVLVISLASFSSESPLWRLTVLKEKALGKIPEIPWLTLIRWMRPGGATYVGALADLPNVNASVDNLHLDAKAVEAGARIYGANCRECHGENARGQTGPDLLAAIGGLTDWAFFSTV